MIIWKGSTYSFLSVNMLTVFGWKPWRSCQGSWALASLTHPFITLLHDLLFLLTPQHIVTSLSIKQNKQEYQWTTGGPEATVTSWQSKPGLQKLLPTFEFHKQVIPLIPKHFILDKSSIPTSISSFPPTLSLHLVFHLLCCCDTYYML